MGCVVCATAEIGYEITYPGEHYGTTNIRTETPDPSSDIDRKPFNGPSVGPERGVASFAWGTTSIPPLFPPPGHGLVGLLMRAPAHSAVPCLRLQPRGFELEFSRFLKR